MIAQIRIPDYFSLSFGQTSNMHIDTDMDSGVCSTGTSASAVYATQHDLTPYSTVSSFNLPATADSTLLTPTSLSGSPSSRNQPYHNAQQQQHQHQQHKRKATHSHYSSQQTTVSSKVANPVKPLIIGHSPALAHAVQNSYSHHQQLTPPATTPSMHYPYETVPDSNPDEQTSSAPSYDLNYIHSSKEDGLSNMGPYPFPSYPVTGPQDATSGSPAVDYPFGMGNSTGSYFPPQQRPLPPPSSAYAAPYAPAPQHGAHPQHHSQAHGLAPLLAQPPRPTSYRSSAPTITASTEHQDGGPAFMHSSTGTDGRRPTGSVSGASSDHRRTPRTQAGVTADMSAYFRRGNSVGNAYGAAQGSAENGVVAKETATSLAEGTRPSAETVNQCVTSQQYVELNDKANDEDRYLFQVHQQQKEHRGKGMWESIAHLYGKKYPEGATMARLQMKFTRAVRRHARWPKEDYDILIKVYEEEEKNRFSRLCAAFKENGGGRNWDWKPMDIEMLLVRLGLEEPLMDETTKIRRRRRSALRRHTAKGEPEVAPQGHAVVMPPAWNGGYGSVSMPGSQQYPLPSPHHPQQQQQQQLPHHQGNPSSAAASNQYGMAELGAIPTQSYTSDEEIRILDQLDRKYANSADDSASPMESHAMSNTNSVASNAADPSVGSGSSMMGIGGGGLLPLPAPSAVATSAPHFARVTREPYDTTRIKEDPYR